jgi:glycosyltransferase involved in cell wall biosynthesis
MLSLQRRGDCHLVSVVPVSSTDAGPCVVGPGTRFLSGITYYTYGLTNALASHGHVSVILLRRLLPQRLYPGRCRVGADLAGVRLPEGAAAFDGLDWFWVPSLLRAIVFLRRRRPRTLVLQWWTGTVLHSYLALALAARLMRIPLVIEFHEALDTGEDRIPLAGRYVNALAPRLFRGASAYIVHTEHDRDLVCGRFGLDPARVSVVPHAIYTHSIGAAPAPLRPAPADVCNLLFFGVIRPFKGLDDLLAAFDAMGDDEVGRYWLTIVGESWEGVDAASMVERSRHRDRITLVNRYVTEAEADGYFQGADAVVLPYHRSSQSGPLHMAFGYGLPTVVTSVGGLVEAVEPYAGAVVVAPHDPESLLDGIRRVAPMRGSRFSHPQSWASVGALYADVLEGVR